MPDDPNLFTHPIDSIVPDDGGFTVTLTCGHSCWWAILPPTGPLIYCSQCLQAALDARKRGPDA